MAYSWSAPSSPRQQVGNLKGGNQISLAAGSGVQSQGYHSNRDFDYLVCKLQSGAGRDLQVIGTVKCFARQQPVGKLACSEATIRAQN
jgi:hypothetical protein